MKKKLFLNLLVVFGFLGFSVVSLASTLKGQVVLGKEMAEKVAKHKDGVLYVFARPADKEGRGFPLAVKRIASPKFPVKFSLSQKDAMVEGTKFEGAVKIVARFSPSGGVMPKKGALEGVVGEDASIVVGKAKDIKVVISKEIK